MVRLAHLQASDLMLAQFGCHTFKRLEWKLSQISVFFITETTAYSSSHTGRTSDSIVFIFDIHQRQRYMKKINAHWNRYNFLFAVDLLFLLRLNGSDLSVWQ